MNGFFGIGSLVLIGYFSFLTLGELALEMDNQDAWGAYVLVLVAGLLGMLVVQYRQRWFVLFGLSLGLALWSWIMPNMPVELSYALGREEVGTFEHYLSLALYSLGFFAVFGVTGVRYITEKRKRAEAIATRRRDARRRNEEYRTEKAKLMEQLRAERVDWARTGTVTGKVNHYVPAKQTGFIDGDDGVSYYFRKDAVRGSADPVANQPVAFDAVSTPKGARAKAIDLGPMSVEVMVPPDDFIVTKQSSIKGYEITKVIERNMVAEFRGPDEARNHLKSEAMRVGANAIINLNMPALYVLEFADTPWRPVYIGEFDKAISYDLRSRLRAHMSTRESETRARLHKNLAAQGEAGDLNLVGYAFRLPPWYGTPKNSGPTRVEATCRRQSLEARVIHAVCFDLRIAHPWFAVTRFAFGTHYRDRKIISDAQAIIQGYRIATAGE